MAAVPVLIILIWLFAVPEDLIQEKIEGAISNAGQGNISASMTGFRKGFFISVYADSLEIKIDNTPALTITDLTGRLNPGELIKARFIFSVKGNIGTGRLNGLLKYPADAEIQIDSSELSAVSYLSSLGVKGDGHLSGNISLKDNSAKITFQVPDLAVQESAIMVPFVDTFHKAQGVLSVTGNIVKFESVSLEGEKGYARLKGDITNGVKNLSLELMPVMDRLNSLESMLIAKYLVSPGYYVVPVK